MNPFESNEPSAYRMAVAQHHVAMAHAVKIMRNYGGSLSIDEMARGIRAIMDAFLATAPSVEAPKAEPVTDKDLAILEPDTNVGSMRANGWSKPRIEPLDEQRPT